MAERPLCMRKAQGSNPCSSTHTQLRGAMDSVSDFESGGCGFESRRSCCCSTAWRRSLARRDRAGHARTRRHGRRVHLRREVRRRELRAQAHGRRRFIDGERGPRHERVAVLHLHGEDGLARRAPRRLRGRPRGHGRRQGRREGWQWWRQDDEDGRDHGLGRARAVGGRPGMLRFNISRVGVVYIDGLYRSNVQHAGG